MVDVGCGDGALCRFLAGRGARVVGVDRVEAVVRAARDRSPANRACYLAGRGERLPLRDRSADAVVFWNSLHHVPPEGQAEALREAARVLVAGGIVFVLEPLPEGPLFEVVRIVDDETEVRRRAYETMLSARAWGLTVEHEIFFREEVRFRDCEELEAALLAVDETRSPTLRLRRGDLRRAFRRLSRRTERGFRFDQPCRANLLRKGGMSRPIVS